MALHSKLRLGLLACVLSTMPVMAQDEPDPDEDGGGFLENLIEDRLSSDGFQVRVSGFEGALSSRATVASIQISDEEGVWLTVNDAILDWNRAALLRGRLSVDELTAAEVLLPRLPQGEEQMDVPSPEAQPFQLPELPVSIQLGRLAIERIELGQPVIGEETTMTLEGSASLAGGSGEVDITAERIDGETGIFRIAGSYDNDGRELAIDVALEEGPDGIVASLANLPGRPSVTASIEGSGPLSDFDATIDLDTNGEPRLDGTVSLRETEGGSQGFAVDLGGDVTALFAPNYRPFFGPDVSLQARGAQGAEGGFTLNEFQLAADSITLQGEVSVGADGVPDLIDVTGEIANETGPVLLPVGGEIRVSRIGLDVAFDASAGEEWDAEIVLEGFDQPGVEIERIALDGGGVIAGAGETLAVTAGFDLDATGLAFDDGGVGRAVGDALNGRIDIDYAAGDPIRLEVLRLNGASFALTGEGQVDPDGENVPLSLTAQLDADDLSTFSGLAGTPLGGGASVDLTLDATALSGAFDVTLEGRAQDLGIGNDMVDPLLEGETALSLDAMRDETGLRVERLLLNNAALAVNATADLTSDGGTAEIAARIDDLNRIDPDLSGPAVLELSARRPEDEWRIELTATGAEAEIAGTSTIRELEAESPLAIFELSVDAADLSNFSAFAGRELGGSVDLETRGQTRLNLRQADVVLNGQIADVRIDQEEVDRLLAGQTTLAAAVQRDGPQITVPRLDVSNDQITVTGEAFVASEQSDVDLRIEMPDLSQIVPDMDGPASILLVAQEDAEGWTVDLDANGAGARIIADAVVTDLGLEDRAPRVEGTAELAVEDLSVFSAIADRDLAGSADLMLDGQARFDLSQAGGTVTGRTEDIMIGLDEVDALLAGVTELDVEAQKSGDRIEVETLTLTNPQIQLTGEGRYGAEDNFADLAIRFTELNAIVPEMSGPATIVLDADESGAGWAVDLDAVGAGAEVTADVVVSDLYASDVAPLVDGTAEVTVADLSVFSTLANRDLGGSVDLALDGMARFDLTTAEAMIEGRTEDIVIGQEQVDALFAGVTDLTVDAERVDDRLQVSALNLTNPQVQITGEGSYGAEDNAADLIVRFPDLNVIVPEMSGPATIALDADEGADGWTVDLNGTGAGARVVADLLVSDLDTVGASPLVDGTAEVAVADLSVFSTLAGRALDGSVDLTVDGQSRFDLSSAEAVIDGRTEDLAIGQAEVDRLLDGVTTLNITAAKQGDRISAPTIQLSNPQIRVAGEAQYGGDDNAAQLNVVVSELSDILPELSGRATAVLFAEQTGQTWQISVDGDGAGVVLDVLGEVSDLQSTPVFDGDIELRAADLSRFSRLANRTIGGSLALEAQGSVAVDASRFDVVAAARGTGLRTGVAQADQLLAGGSTILNLRAARSGADAPIRVQTFELDAPGLDASANGAILGGGSNLTFDARLANLGQFVPGFDGPVTANGTAGQQGSNIALDVDLTGPQGITASVDGTVAQSFDRANLGLTGVAPLRVANPFLGDRALSGDARFDIRLNGPLAPSSATGTVTVAGGRFVDPSLPAVLEDINGTASLQGGQVQLNLTANKQEGGQIRVAGPISLNPGYNANIGIELVQVVFEDPRLYRTSLNGRVTIIGPLIGGATIGGTIMVGETEVRIPSTGLGVTGPIPDGLVHVNEPADVRRTREKADLIEDPSEVDGGGGIAFPLDLLIVAENRIFVRGRGLDAELGGQLRLTGTTANVIPAGQFDLIRGRLDLLGQRIVLSEGAIFLQGDFDPRIRLVARTDTGDVTVFVIVEGEATSPEITFASEPELPEDEVLSRLLFGRSIQDISALQAAQLASAVATLAGRGGDGLVARLRKSTGFDDLDVTTDEDGNVGLRAGKYISENVYTDVTVNSGGEAEINLNLDVTDSLTVRGGASNAGETSLGIFFERDY